MRLLSQVHQPERSKAHPFTIRNAAPLGAWLSLYGLTPWCEEDLEDAFEDTKAENTEEE
jgi:hypothetical protein